MSGSIDFPALLGPLLLGLAACAVWIGILIHAWARPAARLWPPRRPTKATVIWSWGLTIAIYVSLFQLGAREGNTLGLPVATLTAGWIIAILGSLFHSWATASLGLAATSGWPRAETAQGDRCTKGPYAYTAHPQYIGQALSFMGLALASGGTWVWLIAALGSLALCLAALIEHLHLRTPMSR